MHFGAASICIYILIDIKEVLVMVCKSHSIKINIARWNSIKKMRTIPKSFLADRSAYYKRHKVSGIVR